MDKDAPEPGELQSLSSRLRHLEEALAASEDLPDDELLSECDSALAQEARAETAVPVPEAVPVAEAVPAAEPAAEPEAVSETPTPPPLPADSLPDLQPVAQPDVPSSPRCPVCETQRTNGQVYCDECGFMFPKDPPAATQVVQEAALVKTSIKGGRYEFSEPFAERLGVSRHRGVDHGLEGNAAVPIVVVRRPVAVPVVAEAIVEPLEAQADDEIVPSFDNVPLSSLPVTEPLPGPTQWPNPTWEERLLDTAQHPSLPTVLDSFLENSYEYLVEEQPVGRLLWDAWDDPEATAHERFGYLSQVAGALQALHQAGAMLEVLRPEIVVVTPSGQARLADLSDLLPLPLPPGTPVRASLYTAPELVVGSQDAGARADLYSFGAMLYALHVGRELTDMDFERPGQPKPFIPRFPDIHPLFGRLMSKTFCRDVAERFPTDEASRDDTTGFAELIRTLETCRRTLDDVHLEIAAWTTTGMVRTGNEDAFSLLHTVESRQDDLGESCLVLLCDGMGGYEAGEVAAAMAIQVMRKNLLQQKAFAALVGASPFPSELPGPAPETPQRVGPEDAKFLLAGALKEANRQVYAASRTGRGRRGMGCTAEAVYVDARHVVVGHVGDSRTYHLHEGRLIQLTRDQTLVNRLVELGTLTPEEAEDHPRRNELQQAIGGQPEVEPGVYSGVLKPGDWILVCSDGVTNHVKPAELLEMLQSEATSAEMAARRLVNFVNINGATDNATIVVIRAT
jgi:protein phosphatase